MAEKNLLEENKELKKKLAEAEQRLDKLNEQVDVIRRDSEERMSKLSDEIEDLEAEATLNAPIINKKGKTDYEQKTERTSSYNGYLLANETFGWEKIKEFEYKNGDYRFTMRRDMNHPNYGVWKENEDLYHILELLSYSFYRIKGTIDGLNVTFKEIATEPEYALTGWRKLFKVRTKEQKKDIQAKVDEINKAYNEFKKETQEVYDYIKKNYDKDYFLRYLSVDDNNVHPDKSYIYSILERYKIKYVNRSLSMDVNQIKYNFNTKMVELLEAN